MHTRCSWLVVFRWLAAGILGYEVVVLLTTLGFVDWLDNADLYRGDWRLKACGTLVAIGSGLAGGALAGLLGGRHPLPHALAVLPLLVVDTAYVLFVFRRTTPFWFELLGGLTLMLATVAGGAAVGYGRRLARRRAVTPAVTLAAGAERDGELLLEVWCGANPLWQAVVALPFVLFDAGYFLLVFPRLVPLWLGLLAGAALLAVNVPDRWRARRAHRTVGTSVGRPR